MPPSGYKYNNTDLDDLFATRNANDPKANDVNYQVNGSDLSNRYYPSQNQFDKLPYNVNMQAGGTDFSQLFRSVFTPTPTADVTPTPTPTLTPTPSAEMYILTISTVSSTAVTPPAGYGPAGGTVGGDSAGSYSKGTALSVSGTPDSNSDVAITDSVSSAGISGGPASTATDSFVLNQNRTVTITWTWRQVVWQTTSNTGGTTNQTSQSGPIPKQTIVTLIATPSPGYQLSGWSGPNGGYDVTESPPGSGNWYGRCTADGNNIFTATFTPIPTPTPTY